MILRNLNNVSPLIISAVSDSVTTVKHLLEAIDKGGTQFERWRDQWSQAEEAASRYVWERKTKIALRNYYWK